LIDAYRAGERAQVRSLVDALGWTSELKTLKYRPWGIAPSLFSRPGLGGITADSVTQLSPPWPDLVVSCGFRNEPVSRWVRAQSGGRTRTVHIGRPWAAPESFDLVITTPQYHIPARDNVLLNPLTLNAVTPQRLEAAAGRWSDSFSGLPGPVTGVIVGGDSGPYTLGAHAGAQLAAQASARAKETGGSLLVTTSSRTRPEAIESFESGLGDTPHVLYRWRPDDEANPYFGILALAQEFIVTADSIAMLSEAVATGKPVWMFDPGGMRQGSRSADFRLGAWLYRGLMRWGWKPLSRDITRVHAALEVEGCAGWLGGDLTPTARRGETDMERAVARVHALFDDGDPVL
jgi:mitochondrial fission protein ELM1